MNCLLRVQCSDFKLHSQFEYKGAYDYGQKTRLNAQLNQQHHTKCNLYVLKGMLQTRAFQPKLSKEETQQWPMVVWAQDHYLTSRGDSKYWPFGVVWKGALPCACTVWSWDPRAWGITYGCWVFCLGGPTELSACAGGAGVRDGTRPTPDLTLVLEPN